MGFQQHEPACLWLEFDGAAGDHDLSNAYDFIRLLDTAIVGGAEQELICKRDGGRWVLAADETLSISRISGQGVLSVHLEKLDGSNLCLPCTQLTIDELRLHVNGREVARLDAERGVWLHSGGADHLHGIRLEPDGGGASMRFELVPQQRARGAQSSQRAAEMGGANVGVRSSAGTAVRRHHREHQRKQQHVQRAFVTSA